MHPDVAKVFPPRFDGLAEFWFDSAEDAVNVLNDLSTNAHVLAAAEKLIDGDKGVAWLAEVKPWKPETGGTGIKFLAGGSTSSTPPATPISAARWSARSEEHTSELQSLMRISYAVFCLQKTQPYFTLQ